MRWGLAVLVGAVATVAYFVLRSDRLPPFVPPPGIMTQYWGDGAPHPDDKSIVPFTVKFDGMEALRTRLAAAHWKPIPHYARTGWTYGTNHTYLAEFIEYWRKDYDWPKQQALLNAHPMFHTEIAGLKIHFIHVKKPASPPRRAVLLLHGWPGSFFEFHEAIGMLTDPQGGEEAFDVVVPSLPGYGFSDAPRRPGYGPVEFGAIMLRLMERLGYDQYAVQGGDWGSMVATCMGQLAPERLLGIHLNFFPHFPPHIYSLPLVRLLGPQRDIDKMFPLLPFFLKFMDVTGYMHLQATKPLTIGPALADSPLGMAAHIIEKFNEWGDTHGNIESRFSKDVLLNNLMIYWISGSIESSLFLYTSLRFSEPYLDSLLSYVPTPTALAEFPADIITMIAFPEHRYNLVRFSELPRGGHFAALEEPRLLVDDLRAAISDFDQHVKRAKASA